MNELDPRDNGMPAWAGDLEFMQEAIKEAMKGLINPGANCVLRGCYLSQNGTDFEITEGWVFIDGEVFYVPGETVKGNDNGGAAAYDATTYTWPTGSSFVADFAFEVQEEWTGNGNKKFYDNTFRNTYKQRRARARFNETGTYNAGDSDYLSIAGPLFIERQWVEMQSHVRLPFLDSPGLLSVGPAPISVRYDGDANAQYGQQEFLARWGLDSIAFPPLANGWSGNPQAHLTPDGIVHFSGQVDGNSATDPVWHDGSFFPPRFRPDREVNIHIGDARELTIKTNGELSIGSQNQIYSLEGVSYVPKL